jgi:hypothetical protein
MFIYIILEAMGWGAFLASFQDENIISKMNFVYFLVDIFIIK